MEMVENRSASEADLGANFLESGWAISALAKRCQSGFSDGTLRIF
jgi:hypothetical protein